MLARLKAEKLPLAAIRTQVDSLVAHIELVLAPRAVYLIGSAARDEFTAYSDIDFVIVVDSPVKASDVVADLHRGRPWIERAVDFIVMEQEQFDAAADRGGMAFEARHHGIRLR